MQYLKRNDLCSVSVLGLLAGLCCSILGCVATSEGNTASSKVDPQSGGEGSTAPRPYCVSPIYGFVEIENDHDYVWGRGHNLVENLALLELIDGQIVQHNTRGDEEADFYHCSLPPGYLTTPGYKVTSHYRCEVKSYNPTTKEFENYIFEDSVPFYAGPNGELLLKIQDGFEVNIPGIDLPFLEGNQPTYPLAVVQVPIFSDWLKDEKPEYLDDDIDGVRCSVGLSRESREGHVEEIQWCDLYNRTGQGYTYGRNRFTCGRF